MDWNQYINNLSTNPMFNMGMGMLSASGPSMQPVGFGQALSSGMQTMGQAKHQQQLAEMYQAQMQRMQDKTKQEQEAAAQARQEQQAMFGNPASPDGQAKSPEVQRFLADPMTRVLYHQSPGDFWKQYQAVANPQPQAETGELGMLRAMQQDPSLLATYQKMHPRAVVAGGGFGNAPSGYRFTKDGSLEPIPGGPSDPNHNADFALSDGAVDNASWNYIFSGHLPAIGRGKEGIAQRTAIINRAAEIAHQSGVSPQELFTTAGRNKALQSSLTNLQKQSDMMQKSEHAFQNNMNLALSLSQKVDRSGSPLVNKWLLGGKAALGDPEVAALDAAITTAATDYARIMSGQTGAGGTPITTAEEAKKLIRKELSDKQFGAVADVLHQDILGQQQAVDSQRQTILQGMQAFGSQPQPSQGGGHQAGGNTYHVGQVITVGGKQYKVTGGDPADPELEAL